MGVTEILTQIDREIALLEKARALLVSGAPRNAKAQKPAGTKRQLTPEGRKRIAEAVKRRWAEQRKAAKAAAK